MAAFPATHRNVVAKTNQAVPVKPKKLAPPKPPKAPKIKPIDPNQAATDNAMSAFRTALAQLQASTPQVDANAIRAPYQAASVATGQLGAGLQSALAQSGQAASDQYTRGLGEAQKTAAQFGISAGAGAQPTALQNTGSQLLAQQTQAQTAAAPMATTAWQQLLERTSAAKVADANLQRQAGLTAAEQSLSGSIPGAIRDEKQLGFQQDTAKKNFALAVGTQRDRATNDLRDYLLGVQKTQTSAATAAANTDVKKKQLAQKTSNDAAKLRVSQDKLALDRRTKQATASGLKGVAAAAKALGGASTKPGTKSVPAGWDVTVVSLDPDTGEAGTETQTLPNIKDARPSQQGFAGGVPKTYKIISSTPARRTVATAGGSASITRSTWDTQYRALLAQNPGRQAEVKAFMGPRPKK